MDIKSDLTGSEEYALDPEVAKEINRVQRIKFLISILLIAIIAFLAFKFWSSDGTYLIGLKAEPDSQWVVADISDEGVVELVSDYIKGDTYYFNFQGTREGETEIKFLCIKDGEMQNPEDNRTYQLKVNDSMMIAQGRITRE